MSVAGLSVSDAQFERVLGELGEFVKIDCVSHPHAPEFSMDTLRQGAEFAGRLFTDLGMEVEQFVVDDCAPFVIAKKIVDVSKPTLLLYAHYDVQPVERDRWDTDPFSVVRKGDRLYGRGASDDKAGILAAVAAMRVFQEAGMELPCNIKFISEGEEEYGSEHMQPMLDAKKDDLQADALVVIDGANRDVETGTIETSTRGVLTMEVEVKALDKPTHSGTGCLAPCPGLAIAGLLDSLKDPRKIPGYMDGCTPMSDEEARLLAESSITAAQYGEEVGMVPGGKLRGDSTKSVYERLVSEPSISVLDITCGKKGAGNSVKDTAHATIQARLTPGQDPEQVAEAIQKYVEEQELFCGLHAEFRRVGLSAKAWKADVTKPLAQKCYAALGDAYPKTTFMPTGGTLPLFDQFSEAFPNMEMLILGVEDPETAAHSHNESQHVPMLRRAINGLVSFMQRVGEKD